MTVIEGNIQDIGMAPLSGVLVATSVDFRASGDVVIAPESRSFPVEAGLVSADLVPGPTRLTVQVGSHARGEFDVVVPDEGPVSLALLVEEAFPWEPPQVREFVRLRDEAVAAAARAEQAASDAAGSASSALGWASAAAGSASDAAASAAAAGDQATLAGERAGDAGVARDAAAASAAAAAGSASDAASSASDAAGSATAAASSASDAASSASAAASSASAAGADADRAQQYAEDFDLTATTTTGAPGAPAQVTVTGDGPAYGLVFTVPQGEKGDPGPPGEVSQAALDAAVASLVAGAPEALDTLSELASALGDDPNFATTVSTQIGQRALIDGAPAAYNTLGKLVTALQNHELGGSTDASLLTGALTTAVDITNGAVYSGGQPVGTLWDLITMLALADHTHPVADLDASGTASSSTYLRGDGTWATPLNTTYAVPSQAEAEAGTATTGRAFSAQRVRQAANAAISAREWVGTQAQYDALGSYDPDVTYFVEEDA